MSRRLLALATAALAAFVGAGCTDDVAPAAQIGDVRITESELLDEVAEWAGNDDVMSSLRFPPELVNGAADESYSAQMVGLVLSANVTFEMHRLEFEKRGLELDDDVRGAVRDRFFPEVEPKRGSLVDRIVDAIAQQSVLQQELGEDGYNEWLTGAAEDVEVSPRFGTWDPEAAQVIPPTDPAAPAAPAPAP